MARHAEMHDTCECSSPGCRAKAVDGIRCEDKLCPARYCHAHAVHPTHDVPRFKLSNTGWMPWDALPPLGPFEGMPVKKAIKARKAAAKADLRTLKRLTKVTIPGNEVT